MAILNKLAVGLLLCLVACSQAPDVPQLALNGVNMRSSFSAQDRESFKTTLQMLDHNGVRQNVHNFKNQIVIVTFGYTHCPDFCPTTLAELAFLKQKLGQDANRVQVLFVSIDPERDSPELLKNYVTAFDPSFLALHGTDEELRAIKKTYNVVAEKNGDGDNYSIDHSTGSYILDTTGELHAYFPYGLDLEKQLEDIHKLLHLK